MTSLDADLLQPAQSAVIALNIPPAGHVGASLLHRRSAPTNGRVSIAQVLQILSPLMRVNSEWRSADGYVEKSAGYPSAGGRHPLTALVLLNRDDERQVPHQVWASSPSLRPELRPINLHQDHLDDLTLAIRRALRAPSLPGAVIVALARFRRTTSKYPDGESLVWRDAGVFLGYAHLLASDAQLASQIVGIEHSVAIPLSGTKDRLVDVGALAVGALPVGVKFLPEGQRCQLN